MRVGGRAPTLYLIDRILIFLLSSVLNHGDSMCQLVYGHPQWQTQDFAVGIGFKIKLLLFTILVNLVHII